MWLSIHNNIGIPINVTGYINVYLFIIVMTTTMVLPFIVKTYSKFYIVHFLLMLYTFSLAAMSLGNNDAIIGLHYTGHPYTLNTAFTETFITSCIYALIIMSGYKRIKFCTLILIPILIYFGSEAEFYWLLSNLAKIDPQTLYSGGFVMYTPNYYYLPIYGICIAFGILNQYKKWKRENNIIQSCTKEEMEELIESKK